MSSPVLIATHPHGPPQFTECLYDQPEMALLSLAHKLIDSNPWVSNIEPSHSGDKKVYELLITSKNGAVVRAQFTAEALGYATGYIEREWARIITKKLNKESQSKFMRAIRNE